MYGARGGVLSDFEHCNGWTWLCIYHYCNIRSRRRVGKEFMLILGSSLKWDLGRFAEQLRESRANVPHGIGLLFCKERLSIA
ncbi:hypothetical protein VFPPC_15956 [Pochonia chlamydosporia 170]|uniref:Uncharacterized protein n=1 Tax=Pochonia chlamydosporia 170 TaxID=1380566 RepID=A0A179FKV9_METCM|nr:hypothetical protein VFPPC_15956 [Pochonia chlamydosporia 170]OAQ65850.1 hypothetical protein VFPPC_15956 [Pochonia chlamydosporia 170]